jgi:hypothetical protein
VVKNSNPRKRMRKKICEILRHRGRREWDKTLLHAPLVLALSIWGVMIGVPVKPGQ